MCRRSRGTRFSGCERRHRLGRGRPHPDAGDSADGEDPEQTLARYVWLYNHHVLQKALNHETLVQALKRLQSTHPELFVKQVRDRPGPDSFGLEVGGDLGMRVEAPRADSRLSRAD
jgi:hypothetical protein